MTLDTQITLALLQELLLARRANDAEGFKEWLALGLDELGRQVVIEMMQNCCGSRSGLCIKVNVGLSKLVSY